MAASASETGWKRFAGLAVAAGAGAFALLLAIAAIADPYGLRAAPGRPPGPIMDSNQRFVYPQIVRSRVYDSAVFGTSTLRLLDPQRLDRAFGGRFANLAMNAATPWEQVQAADLFLRELAMPRTLIFGIDRTWCEADADAPGKRITFRSFPPWLYDEVTAGDWLRLANFQTVEIALRHAAHKVGLMPERMRNDGFEVFTPPEAAYDLARARGHIWGAAGPPAKPPVPAAPAAPVDAMPDAPFPALRWLDALLESAPPATGIMLVLPPVHVAAQAQGAATAREEACKARLAAIADRHGVLLVDFRYATPLTVEDSNYWDPLHVRLPVAEEVVRMLGQAASGARSGPSWRVLP